MTVGIKIKNRRLRSLSHHHISHYARIQIRSHPKLESQRRTHIAPDLMEPCQFAIGQRVGVHDFAGEELGTLEVDMPMRFCDASNAIMRCVSEHTETPMGAISLVWERCDFVRYVVGSYSYWQLPPNSRKINQKRTQHPNRVRKSAMPNLEPPILITFDSF